jgi:N6-adenosine-specific RNA methylase IME4
VKAEIITSDVTEAAVLALPGKVSRVGLELPPDLTFRDWQNIGEQLERVEGAVLWWWGDWLRYDDGSYGTMYEEAMDKTGAKYQRLANAKWVAESIEFSTRVENVSWSHHRLVAALDKEEQARWLARAEKNKWSVKDLKHHITKQKRDDKHRSIAGAAVASSVKGSFPLIYADPPWVFDTYSWKGKENSPDKHYPTLDDEAIMAFEVDGRAVPDLAYKDAALYLWCTSSNIVRALAVMEAWGFAYKTHAVWDKERTGMGYVFLNQHEVLLYGTRGGIPAPLAIRSSIFKYPRQEHSKKPDEVRLALEEMYPHFDEPTRIEMFARGPVEGWTVDGFELC